MIAKRKQRRISFSRQMIILHSRNLMVHSNYSTSQLISPLSISSLKDLSNSNLLLSTLKDIYLRDKLVIRDENATESLNSPSSLPMTLFPKDAIFMKVVQDDRIGSWRKPFVKWFRLGVFMVKYYKEGVKNTCMLSRNTRPLVKQYGDKLIADFCKRIEFNEIEHRLKRKSGKNEPIKLLPLDRKKFVEFERRKEVWKIPLFFIMVLIFEELTAAICYLCPKLALHNCLTPGAFTKITKVHANHELGRLCRVPTYKSPYTMSADQVFAKLTNSSLRQTTKWKLLLCRLADNGMIPRETLATIHQYLFVDDWLLLQHVLHSEVTVLAPAELVDCVRLRQLYKPEEDLNAMANDPKNRRVLVWRLLIYWAFRFDKTVTCGGNFLFAEKWGVNNVSILNYSGWENGDLIGTSELPVLELR